jgi:hypothetical protein
MSNAPFGLVENQDDFLLAWANFCVDWPSLCCATGRRRAARGRLRCPIDLGLELGLHLAQVIPQSVIVLTIPPADSGRWNAAHA